jgi:hypothetical protein
VLTRSSGKGDPDCTNRELVVSANGFDKGIYLDSTHGFFPHVPFVPNQTLCFFYVQSC